MSRAPLLLAFDTSASVGSVALGRGRDVLARRFLTRRGEHGARLVASIEEVLEEAGVERRSLEGLVVGCGPGSFTGVRIAAATAKGLARGLGCPLWLHSSLAAGAASSAVSLPSPVRESQQEWRGGEGDRHGMNRGAAPQRPPPAEPTSSVTLDRPAYVLFDARGERIYGACYRFLDGSMNVLRSPRAATVREVLNEPLPADVLFCGDGAVRHAATLTAAGHPVAGWPAGLPTAEGLLRVHALMDEDQARPDGRGWEPTYLRGSSADRAATFGGSGS